MSGLWLVATRFPSLRWSVQRKGKAKCNCKTPSAHLEMTLLPPRALLEEVTDLLRCLTLGKIEHQISGLRGIGRMGVAKTLREVGSKMCKQVLLSTPVNASVHSINPHTLLTLSIWLEQQCKCRGPQVAFKWCQSQEERELDCVHILSCCE